MDRERILHYVLALVCGVASAEIQFPFWAFILILGIYSVLFEIYRNRKENNG
jgi:ABC-type multidrug transport system permease subunit